MLAFAFVAVGAFDGETLTPFDLEEATFSRELRPISDAFQPDALAVNGLDRARLQQEGADPQRAMDEAAVWIRNVARGNRPVLVAYPAAFDWTWLYWYFVRFAKDGCPFGFSGCLDIKTIIAVKSGSRIEDANPRSLPEAVRAGRPHTHRALDDAKEQGELFLNLLMWKGVSSERRG